MNSDIQLLEQVRDKERQARLVLLALAKSRREIIIRLSKAGFTYRQLAPMYGVSYQRIEQIINKKG